MRAPGILRRSSTMVAGNSLNTGAGELARITISPFIFARVLPIRVRIPWVTLNNPSIAIMGIVRPTTAKRVRVGRVVKFCQANRHIHQFLSTSGPSCHVRIPGYMEHRLSGPARRTTKDAGCTDRGSIVFL